MPQACCTSLATIPKGENCQPVNSSGKNDQRQVPLRLWPRVQFKIRDVGEIGQDTSLDFIWKIQWPAGGQATWAPGKIPPSKCVYSWHKREVWQHNFHGAGPGWGWWLWRVPASSPHRTENLLDTGTIICFRFGGSPQTFQSSRIKLRRAPGDGGFN